MRIIASENPRGYFCFIASWSSEGRLRKLATRRFFGVVEFAIFRCSFSIVVSFVRQNGFTRSAPTYRKCGIFLSYPAPAGFRIRRRRSIVWSFIRRFPASGEARKRASPSPRTGNVWKFCASINKIWRSVSRSNFFFAFFLFFAVFPHKLCTFTYGITKVWYAKK